MKGRKNGCPVNIRNWLIYVLTGVDTWTRIYGLTSMTRTIDSETEDGSAETDTWAEPYVTKRNGSITLEGKEVIEESTGVRDAGQEALTAYADESGCDADATLKFVDPYGHAFIADFIVTSHEVSADDTGTTLSWDLEQVGSAEVQPYVNVTSISLKDGASAVTTLSMDTDDSPKVITVNFTPATASNKRFKVTNTRKSVATVSNVTEDSFTVTPMGAGSTSITITTANGGKTATVAVTVTDA